MREPKQSTCAIVGIGASAGGLDALRRLLGALPVHAPFAIVVIQHLDPTTRSHLAEIIDRDCDLTVVRAKSGDSPVAGTVYVVPEGREPRLEAGKLRLKQRAKTCHEPIDAFFASLAEHNDGCGVILSGNGSDGVLGLRQIRGAGGITFAQDPTTAEFPSMPASAIGADVCDFIGSPEDIARDLMAHVGTTRPKAKPLTERSAKAHADRDAQAMARILGLVRLESGMDFSGYKPATVTRRISRRLMLRDAEDLQGYLALLERDPKELSTLGEDLLINVTEFFRDTEVFESLRTRVLPEILKSKTDSDTLRLWVIGCSTGEEVYSILITALEALETSETKPKITVFGTDASESAVARARAGVYPPNICASVSPERLSKYFVRTEAGFEIDRALREMCVFARQDVTRDTPFSRQDLVSLRNVLIYMDQPLQKQVLSIAHFALVPDGMLLLGTSETTDNQARLFKAFDKRSHVYRRQDVASRLPVDMANSARANIDALSVLTPSLSFDAAVFDAHAAANDMALLMYAPPRVVVDANGHILHFFGDTSPFLTHAIGRATLEVAEMAHPGIALELKDALEAARATGSRAVRDVTFTSGGQKRDVSLEVMPLPSPPGQTQVLIAFRELSKAEAALASPVTNEDLSRLYESREQRVRGELGALRGRLRAVAEEREQVNQSLRSANEEIRSSNEELQSINEELETAKEELQSANEELITVNDELRQSNRDLSLVNDDLTNFSTSIEIPLLMLDCSLRVRRFTPQATRVVRIEDSDIGRLVEHLRLRVGITDLSALAHDVIESEEPCQREVRDENGCWYSMNLLPYRAGDGGVEGVVIAFYDVDALKRSAEQVERRARLGDSLTSIDADLASTMEFTEILQCSLDAGARALAADAGAIEVREEDVWVIRHQYGFTAQDVGRRLSEVDAPNATEAALLGEPVMIADMTVDEGRYVGFVKAHALKSVLAIPLIVRDSTIGCLLFYRRHQATGFTADEVEFGRRLGTSVSLALENSRLMLAEHTATQRAETLNAINEIIRTAITPDQLIARLVGEVSEVAGAGMSLVIEVHGDAFVITHVRGVRSDLVGEPRTADYYPGFALTARLKRPVLIGDTWSDPRTNKDFVVGHGLKAFQLLPLVVDDVAVAVLALAYDETRSFDAEDSAFAQRVCNAMSIALKNAMLFESEVRARADANHELNTSNLLLHAAETFAMELDLERVLDMLVESTIKLTGRHGVFIDFLDIDARTLTIARTARPALEVGMSFPLDALAPDLVRSIDECRPFVLDYTDPNLPEEYKANSRTYNVFHLLSIPLAIGERVLGVILVDEPGDERPFTEREIDVVQGLAREGALAIENARLFEAGQVELARTTILREVAAVAAGTIDARELSERTLEACRERLGAKAGNIYVIDREEDVLVATALFGFPAKLAGHLDRMELDEARGSARSYLKNEVVTNASPDLPAAIGKRANAAHATPDRWVSVPIGARGEVVGSLGLVFDGQRGFSAEEIALYQALAEQLAVGLDKARLFEAERIARRAEADRAERMALLRDIAEIGATSFSTEETGKRLIDTLVRVLNPVTAYVYVLDEDGRHLIPLALSGVTDEYIQTQFGPIDVDGEGGSAEVFRSKVPAFVRDVETDPLLSEAGRAFTLSVGQHSGALMPLLVRGEPIGVLSLGWAEPRGLDADEVTFLESIASEAALGLQSARLFEAESEARQLATRQLENTSQLLAAAHTFADWTDLPGVLDQLAKSVQAATGRKRVFVHIWDEQTPALVLTAAAGEGGAPLGSRYEWDKLAAPSKEALTEKRTMVVDYDTIAEAEGKPYAGPMGFRVALAVPLVDRATLVGLLIVDDPGERHEFEAWEIELVEGIAAQGSAAIRTARLFEGEQNARRKVEALQKVVEFSASSLELVDVIDNASTFIAEDLGVDVITFWALDKEHRRLVPITGVGFPLEFFDRFSAGVGLDQPFEIARSVVEGRPMVRSTHEIDLVPEPVRSAYAEFEVPLEALLVLPVRSRSRVLGAITLAWTTPKDITDEDVAFFSSVVDEMAVGAENAILFQAVSENARLDETLNDISANIHSTLDFQEIMQRCLGDGADALSCDAGVIEVREGDEWRVRYAFGFATGQTGRLFSDDEAPCATRTMQAGRPFIVQDAVCDESVNVGLIAEEGLRSALAVPLIVKDEVTGCLVFYMRERVRTFAETEIDFAVKLAASVSLAMENSQLFEDLDASRRQATHVLESISDGFYALDRDWRFTYANAEAGRMLGTSHDEVLGRDIGDVTGNPAALEFQKQQFAPAMHEGQVVEVENFFEQTAIWADIRVFPSADGVVVYGRDITERRVAEEALRETRERADMMASVLDESAQPFAIGNLDGTLGLVNSAYERLTGYTAEELAHISWASALTPPEYAEMEAEKLAELVQTGKPVRYEKEYVRKDGTRVPVELLVHLNADVVGTPLSYSGFATDLTKRKEIERLDAAFNEIRTAIGGTLEFEEIVQSALTSGATALGADWAAIFSHDAQGWRISHSLGMPSAIGTGLLGDADALAAPLVATSGEPLMINDPSGDGRLDARVVRRYRVKALLAAPLGVKGAELGVLTFGRRKKGEPFTEAQFGFVARVARVVALAIQNAMLYERERAIADTLQDALLTPPEVIPGIETSYVYRPASNTANVGGDFYDVFSIAENRCVIVVGDVSGKGILAARLTSLIHDGIRAYALETSDPTEILTRLNRLVCHLSPPEQFATLFFGILDTETGLLRYSTAGHPAPIVMDRDKAEYLLGTHSPVLGAFARAPFHCFDTVMAPGDRLMLFTDGVTEARRGSDFLGEERLLRIVGKMTRTPTRRLSQRLLDKILDYSDGHLRDDTVILCVERTAKPKPRQNRPGPAERPT
jgi:two-component system, chemotaxis family, CheB/CheR fusion protein